MSTARTHLQAERKRWRQSHPVRFVAKPTTNDLGETNFFTWACEIPGQDNTPWSDGIFQLNLEFSSCYPMEPPIARFISKDKNMLFHPNIHQINGLINIDMLHLESSNSSNSKFLSDPNGKYKSTLHIIDILNEIQSILNNPEIHNVNNPNAFDMYIENRSRYTSFARISARKLTTLNSTLASMGSQNNRNDDNDVIII